MASDEPEGIEQDEPKVVDDFADPIPNELMPIEVEPGTLTVRAVQRFEDWHYGEQREVVPGSWIDRCIAAGFLVRVDGADTYAH